MFLCATSAQKDSNEATDLTASLFQNQLDEPIKVKKFEIELVSSVIRKDNKITITQPDNLLLFRLGPIDAGEAYTAEVEPGVYTLADLAIEIARALNDATPCNAWRGWSCTVDGTNKFTITFTTVSTPALSTIAEITEARLFTRGFLNTYTFDAGANTVSLEPVYMKGGDGNVGIDVRADFFTYLTTNYDVANGASYRAVDIGNSNPENKTTTMVREVGLFEAGGRVEYIISPVPVFQTSTRFAPLTSADDVYLTLEADVENTVYDPNEFEDSFIKDMDMYKGVDELGNLSKHSQKNGILITPAGNVNAKKEGPPYTRSKFTLNFPPMGIDPAEEFDVRRQEKYFNTFGGTMIFDKTTTQKFPKRGFQIAIGESPTETALSTLNFTGHDRENLKFRLATRPLITGLQVKNDTVIATTNILVDGATPAPGETKIEYIVGRVGTMNLRTFGLAAFASSGQGKLIRLGEPDVFKTPVYRIDAIDADGKPTAVTLMDGGEHIYETKALDGGDLFLNDPNTFTITTIGSLTDEEIVTDLCSKLDIGDEAIHIGNLGIFEDVQTAFQYLPTEVGIVNDQIFQAVEEGFDDNIGTNPSFPVRYSKDVSVKITPLSRTNTAEKFVEFQIHQFQPTTADFTDEDEIGLTFRTLGGERAVKTLVFQARPGNWNSLTYSSGTPPANWTAAFAAPDADQRIKITIEQSEIYKQIIKCSFSTDAGVSFQEEITLLESGNKVTGQVPSGPAFKKFEFTTKPRHFPLHPCISQYPSALRDQITTNPDTIIKGIFTPYPRGASYRQGFNVVRGFKGNYEKNLIFQTEGATQPSVFAPFPTTLGNNHRPQIVLKTKQTGFTEVANSSGYPLADGSIREQEVPPIRATLGGILGLHSAYSAEAGFTSPQDFVGASATEVIADIPTVAVEINNIPIDGYISKDYDVRDAQVGVGSRLPIVGVIPSLEETTASTKPQIDFRYNAPYSQPVVCDLPTEQFLYNLSFRLREVSTGRILEGLRHPTELIFRLRNLDEKLEEEKKM